MNNNQRNLPHNYTQLMVANAVAIDVAIVATHLKTEITIFFFILHSSLFTIDSSNRACSRSAMLKQAWHCSRLIAAFTIPYSLFPIHYYLT